MATRSLLPVCLLFSKGEFRKNLLRLNALCSHSCIVFFYSQFPVPTKNKPVSQLVKYVHIGIPLPLVPEHVFTFRTSGANANGTGML